MSIYEQFMDLKYHAAEVDQEPTRWIVGPGVVETVQKYMGMPCRITDGDNVAYLGIPMERSVDLPDGRVTLKCGEWSAGGFTLNTHSEEDSTDDT
jgi:hypothetical protein